MNRSRARAALSAAALLGALGGLAGIAGLAGCSTGTSAGSQSASAQSAGPGSAAMDNPNLDLGSSLGDTAAPDFRLRNQFGQPMSLSQFRGKVVMLAFEDSQCTTVCPLTTQSMLQAKQLLGAAGNQVQLLGIDANPDATRVADVLSYSRAHGLVNQWDFLTGSLAQLKAAWGLYHIAVQIQGGTVALGPGQPRLVMFFATWLSEVSDLKSELGSGNAYAAAARRDGLPQLVAVDETVVEPSAQTVRSYLRNLGTPLDYPVALDTTGRVADGYGVQDQPWFVLVSASGKVIWSHDGWLPLPALESAARRAASA